MIGAATTGRHNASLGTVSLSGAPVRIKVVGDLVA
jgi:hypothetical protein